HRHDQRRRQRDFVEPGGCRALAAPPLPNGRMRASCAAAPMRRDCSPMRPLAAILAAILALGAAPAPPEAAAWETALRSAEKDLCGKQVALLGENGFHGEGKTVAFKAELIRRLVTHCGYRGVFFEASHYDFLAVQRAAR